MVGEADRIKKEESDMAGIQREHLNVHLPASASLTVRLLGQFVHLSAASFALHAVRRANQRGNQKLECKCEEKEHVGKTLLLDSTCSTYTCRVCPSCKMSRLLKDLCAETKTENQLNTTFL